MIGVRIALLFILGATLTIYPLADPWPDEHWIAVLGVTFAIAECTWIPALQLLRRRGKVERL